MPNMAQCATYVLPRVITNKWHEREEYWYWKCVCGAKSDLAYSHQSAVSSAMYHEAGYTKPWQYFYDKAWNMYPAYIPIAVRESYRRGKQ